VVKLNRLIQRRALQLRRRPVQVSVNPIKPVDLAHLKAWAHKGPYVGKSDCGENALLFRELAAVDLPAGFGFDQFGLLVRKERQQPCGVPEGVPDDMAEPGEQSKGPRKRQSSLNDNEPQRKRARAAVCRERSKEGQREDLASVLRGLDEEFAEKERLS